jgi:hypothetical protein
MERKQAGMLIIFSFAQTRFIIYVPRLKKDVNAKFLHLIAKLISLV